MDLEKIRSARSLYYQCFGELFIFSFSGDRLKNLKQYLQLLKEYSFDDGLDSYFDDLLSVLDSNGLDAFYKEFDDIFISIKDSLANTFSYIEEGFENSKALVNVREIMAKSKIRRNEKKFKESEDNIGFCFLLMSEFLKDKEDELAKELFSKVINIGIDSFLEDLYVHKKAKIYKNIAYIAMAFIEFERFCMQINKPEKINNKKVQNDLSRSEFLRRETNKKRRESEKS